MLVEALHRYGVIGSNSSEKVIRKLCCSPWKEECLIRQCLECTNNVVAHKEFDFDQEAAYKAWKTVKESRKDNKGKNITVQITKKDIVKSTLGNIVNMLENTMPSYMKHVRNIDHQHEVMDWVKDNLDYNSVLIHVDFSENFSCKYSSEVQSVHFGASRQQVTLHTGILYYKDTESQSTNTISFCSLSESLCHDPAAIWAHLTPVLQLVISKFTNIEVVHFLSDGPTTQYRNHSNFYLLKNYMSEHCPSVKRATWNFSESGHEKGAPDGIGGTLKRTADKCVARGNDIACYQDLINLLKRSCQGIMLFEIVLEDIAKVDTYLAGTVIRPFKGTMQVHQVALDLAASTLQFRALSCFKCDVRERCIHGLHIGEQLDKRHPGPGNIQQKAISSHARHNQAELLLKMDTCSDTDETGVTRLMPPTNSSNEDTQDPECSPSSKQHIPSIGDWVVAIFYDQWVPGTI